MNNQSFLGVYVCYSTILLISHTPFIGASVFCLATAWASSFWINFINSGISLPSITSTFFSESELVNNNYYSPFSSNSHEVTETLRSRYLWASPAFCAHLESHLARCRALWTVRYKSAGDWRLTLLLSSPCRTWWACYREDGRQWMRVPWL